METTKPGILRRMKVGVGSLNKTKVAAVQDAVLLYPDLFPEVEVKGVDVQIDLYGHPDTIEKTIQGAIDRAKQAHVGHDIGIGLEGGLIAIPQTRSGHMETGACAIYDGKSVYLGLAPSFEWPRKVTEMILRGEADASQAFKLLGLTNAEKLGAMDGGIIGMLTNGRHPREDFSRLSIIMALIHLEQAEMYA